MAAAQARKLRSERPATNYYGARDGSNTDRCTNSLDKLELTPPDMPALATSVAEEVLELKRERRAILLAHHYQDAEIQEIADVVGAPRPWEMGMQRTRRRRPGRCGGDHVSALRSGT